MIAKIDADALQKWVERSSFRKLPGADSKTPEATVPTPAVAAGGVEPAAKKNPNPKPLYEKPGEELAELFDGQHTPEENLAKARKVGFRASKRNLEVKTWNNDIRGVMTLFGWFAYWMMSSFLFGQWVNVISLYMTGYRVDGSFLTKTTR